MSTEVLGTSTANEQPWIPDDSTFGARLALVRWRMGWNVKEAAAECGIAAATWRLWEVSGSLPHNLIVRARKISDRTGCDLAWLVGMPKSTIARYAPRAGQRDTETGRPPTKPERPVRTQSRPVDNRPTGKPRSSDTTGLRRTEPVSRSGPGRRA